MCVCSLYGYGDSWTLIVDDPTLREFLGGTQKDTIIKRHRLAGSMQALRQHMQQIQPEVAQMLEMKEDPRKVFAVCIKHGIEYIQDCDFLTYEDGTRANGGNVLEAMREPIARHIYETLVLDEKADPRIRFVAGVLIAAFEDELNDLRRNIRQIAKAVARLIGTKVEEMAENVDGSMAPSRVFLRGDVELTSKYAKWDQIEHRFVVDPQKLESADALDVAQLAVLTGSRLSQQSRKPLVKAINASREAFLLVTAYWLYPWVPVYGQKHDLLQMSEVLDAVLYL